MKTGVTWYVNSPGKSALRGKWTQRNFWMGDSLVDSSFGFNVPSTLRNASRFLRGKYCVPFGSLYSMAKPTKFRGGVPFFQFMARSAIPSPRCTFNVKSAAAFLPLTTQAFDMATSYMMGFLMSGVRILVGTRKGAFVLTADGKRERWDVSGPF